MLFTQRLLLWKCHLKLAHLGETSPFRRKATFKLHLIIVRKQDLKCSNGSVLCLSGCLKENKFSALSDVKSVVMKSASSPANLQGLLQRKLHLLLNWFCGILVFPNSKICYCSL